jgi:hypothetical protein
MLICSIRKAEPYRIGVLSSTGTAKGMLICQFDYPLEYLCAWDKHIEEDHDRCLQRDYSRVSACFKNHTGTGDGGLSDWAYTARKDQVMSLIQDVLRADCAVTWTGCRILGTVNRYTGYTVWSLALFAKHPESTTKVYTGPNAPNAKKNLCFTPFK